MSGFDWALVAVGAAIAKAMVDLHRIKRADREQQRNYSAIESERLAREHAAPLGNADLMERLP
jgi:hypothetical protein